MNVMTKAHKLTKEVIQAGDNYNATFSLCLKAVYAESKKKTDMLDVLVEMKNVQEGGGYVYLDNVDLQKLNITKEQFSGFCSALTRAGVYQPVDGFFGRLID